MPLDGRYLLACLLIAQGMASAQQGLPAQLRDVKFEQRLNEKAPLDLAFRDETGREVTLGEYFHRKPVVLALVYYECPMLCTMVLNGVVRSVRAMPLQAGKDYEIVAVSIDPAEGPELAARKKKEYVREGSGRSAAGWHFLTGREESIRALAGAVGFSYTYDPATKQFAHASGITILTPNGTIARYLYGVEYSARDLRLALVEASAGKIGSAVDQVLLYCFHYDPTTGKYGLLVMNVIRVLGTATVAALGTFMVLMFRRDRQKGPGQS
jgi:protein SCO1/2